MAWERSLADQFCLALRALTLMSIITPDPTPKA
jgi:hypothetical protein